VTGTKVDGHEDRGRDDHPADGGRDRQRGPRGFTQVARHELAFELQADHEEEDGQQTVGRPRRQAELQVKGLRAERELRDRAV
jgi:hypothetical protein